MELSGGVATPGLFRPHHYTVAERLQGFGLSALESFPELFGIRPSLETEQYRADNPVSGFLSQMVGAFVPYVGAAKALRAVPLLRSGIVAMEALGGENAIARGALSAMAEAGMTEAGRLALSATPVPGALYSGLTGRDGTRTESLGDLAVGGLANVAAGGVIGGALGGIGATLARGVHLSHLSGVANDAPLPEQIRALNTLYARAIDPNDPLQLTPEMIDRVATQRNTLMRYNAFGVEPQYGDNGDVIGRGDYTQNMYRPLEGERRSRPIGTWLSRAMRLGRRSDGLSHTRALAFDPSDNTGQVSERALAEVLNAVGYSREELLMHAQDIRTIEVRPGTGRPQARGTPADAGWDGVEVPRMPSREQMRASGLTPGEISDVLAGRAPELADQVLSGHMFDPATGRMQPATREMIDLRAAQRNAAHAQATQPIRNALAARNPNAGDYFSAIGDSRPMFYQDWVKRLAEDDAAHAAWGALDRELFQRATRHRLGRGSLRERTTPDGPTGRSMFNPIRQTPTAFDQATNKAKTMMTRFTDPKVWYDIGNGWRMAREQKDGMWVVNRQVRGTPGTPAAGDKWIFMRTDRPEFFNPRAAKAQRAVMRGAYFPPPKIENAGEVIWDTAGRMRDMFEREAVGSAAPGQTTSEIVSGARQLVYRAGTYVSPSAMLGTRNPLLNLGLRLIDSINALAESRVSRLMYGEHQLEPGKSVGEQILSTSHKTTEGLAAFINKLSAADRQTIKDIEQVGAPYHVLADAHSRGIISDNVFNFYVQGQALSNSFMSRLAALEKVVGPSIAKTLRAFAPRQGHYMLTHEFPGSFALQLIDKDGHVVGTATGHDWANARRVAADIIKQEAGRGNVLTVGGAVDEGIRTAEDLAQFTARMRKPGFIKARSGMIGYAFQRGELTAAELIKQVARNLRMRENYIRDITLTEQTAEILSKLKRTSILDANALLSRLEITKGNEGEFARATNAIVDKALSVVGFTGKDSATAIVRATHRALASWTFGFGNIPQALFNITGMFQTLAPEIAFMLHASPETLARNYASLPVFSSQGGVIGTLGVLSPWKVLKNAMGRLSTEFGKTEPEFQEMFLELVRRRKIAPQYMESQFGSNGELLRNPKQALEQGHSVVDLFNAANELGISKTEELNRAMTVAASYEIGKAAGLSGERLVFLAEDMISKVNYNYQTVDRAHVFTTPLGSLIGTFKNWMFHYMGSMIRYAGAGRQGVNALMWQTAATATLGGAAATPFLIPIANGFSQFFTGNSAAETLYEAAGNLGLDERVSDGIMYGLPGALGVSLSSQVASPGADPARDAQMLFSIAAADRMKALGTGFGDAYQTYLATGQNPFSDSRVLDQMMRALAPRSIYRAMAVSQGDALRSMATGDPVLQHIGIGGAALYTLGFNPTMLDRTYEAYNEIRNDQVRQRQMVAQLGEALSQAQESGDQRASAAIFARAMAMGLDTSSILRSAHGRTQRGQQTQLERAASAEDRQRYAYAFPQGG